MKFEFNWPSGFRGEDVRKCLTDGRTDDGRTTDAEVTGILIAHLGAFGSGELKTNTHQLTNFHMGHNTRKPVFWGLQTRKVQTSLHIHAVWSAPLLFAYI